MKTNHKEVTIVTVCPICGHANEIAVNEADYFDWDDGALVQNAFPYLTAEEREMLISGICPTCWDKTFGDDNEEDSEDWEDDEPADIDSDFGFNPYIGSYDYE